jgi:hypothetical protein
MTNQITTKTQLKEKWNYCKDIPNRYNDSDDKFRRLLKDVYQLVNTSDLDNWVENYDFNKRGDQNYHKIMGKKFPGWAGLEKSIEESQNYQVYPSSVSDFYPEYGLGAVDKMAQQVLARCYIKMNKLVHGTDETWEAKMNWIANSWTNGSLEKEFENKTTVAERAELPQKIQERINSQHIEVR